MTTTIQTRVKKAAKLLDVKRPGWYKQIKCDELDVICYYRCVLAQLYGSFGAAPAYLKRLAAFCGGLTAFCDMPTVEDYQKAWVKEIQKRTK